MWHHLLIDNTTVAVYNRFMNKITLAYLAGVMDSDGYFTIKRSTYNIRKIKDSKNPHYCERVGIKQVQPEAIELIYENFGGYFHIEKPNTKNGKPLNSIQLSNLKAHKFIKAIHPFLRIKKRQADILLKLRKSLNEGKIKKGKTMRKDRWDNLHEFICYSVSDKQIEFRENLITQIKQFNDSRFDVKHQPMPWK